MLKKLMLSTTLLLLLAGCSGQKKGLIGQHQQRR